MAGGKKKNRAGVMARQDSVFFEEVMAFLLLTTVCVSLLWQGLLYEENSIAVVILLSVFSFVVLLKARLADGLDMGQPFIAGLFLLLAAASLLSLLNAVNLHDSVYALCKNSALLLLVLALGALRQKIPLEQWLAKALTYAGVIVALIGLDGVWGGYFAGAVNAFFNSGPLMEGQDGFLFQMMLGDRLSSVFQYPNTTASFLMAAWFAACHRFVFRDVYTKPSAGKWYRRGALYTAGGANLIFLAFVLTLSRGMYLLAVPAMLLYALLLPGEGKRRSLSRFLLAFFPGFLIGVLSLPAAPLRSLHPVLGWLLLLLLFAASGFLAYALTEKAGRPAPAKARAGTASRSGTGRGSGSRHGSVPDSGRDSEPGSGSDSGSASGAGSVVQRLAAWRLSPRTAFLALFALCLCFVLVLVVAWQSSMPFALDEAPPLIRLFSAGEKGSYQVAFRFAAPVDTPIQDIQIAVEGQNRQEMLRGYWQPYGQTDLTPYIGQQEVILPLELSEDGVFLRVSVTNADRISGNALTSISMIPASATAGAGAGSGDSATSGAGTGTGAGASGGRAKQLKLSRFLISESVIQGVEAALNPKTMYDRFGFYLDGFRVFFDYPLTGIGGNGWRYIYGSYQRHPYVSNDLHSYAMQLLVEFGAGGLLVFLGFVCSLIYLLVRCIKLRNEEDLLLLMIAGSFFAHSMIDVDFTFFGQFLLFVMAFALIRFSRLTGVPETALTEGEHLGASGARQPGSGTRGTVSAGAGVRSTASPGSGARSTASSGSGARGTASPGSGARGKASAGSGKRDASMGSVVLRYLRDAVALLVLLLFCCVVSFRFSRANAYAQAYFQSLNEGDTESAETFIRAAAEWDFTKPEYKAAAALQIVRKQVLYGDAFSQSQMLAEGAGKQAQFSTAALGVLMEYYVMTGYNDTAWEISRRLTELEPYLSSYWLLRGELVNAVLSRYPLDAGEADEQAGGLENEAESGSEDSAEIEAENGSENSAEIEEENGPENGLGDDAVGASTDGSAGEDEAAQAARLAEWKEIHRQWLERGLGIPDEMERMSADQWVAIEPGEELKAMVAAWQEALASL